MCMITMKQFDVIANLQKVCAVMNVQKNEDIINCLK